jgi:hypothetical protein
MAAEPLLDAMLHTNSSQNRCKKMFKTTVCLLFLLRSDCLQRLLALVVGADKWFVVPMKQTKEMQK